MEWKWHSFTHPSQFGSPTNRNLRFKTFSLLGLVLDTSHSTFTQRFISIKLFPFARVPLEQKRARTNGKRSAGCRGNYIATTIVVLCVDGSRNQNKAADQEKDSRKISHWEFIIKKKVLSISDDEKEEIAFLRQSFGNLLCDHDGLASPHYNHPQQQFVVVLFNGTEISKQKFPFRISETCKIQDTSDITQDTRTSNPLLPE